MTINKNEIDWLSDQLKSEDHFKNLVVQINKDANLAGIDFRLNEGKDALEIANNLNRIIENLIKNDFAGYLNFLYRIDVLESNLL